MVAQGFNLMMLPPSTCVLKVTVQEDRRGEVHAEGSMAHLALPYIPCTFVLSVRTQVDVPKFTASLLGSDIVPCTQEEE